MLVPPGMAAEDHMEAQPVVSFSFMLLTLIFSGESVKLMMGRFFTTTELRRYQHGYGLTTSVVEMTHIVLPQ